MEWHIITGSKGGVGKTLLALLLSAHTLKKGSGTTLVVDLNSMNADFSKLLFYKAKKGEPVAVPIQTQEEEISEPILLQKTYSLKDNDINQQCDYVVGWPQNPFVMYDPQLFANLLATIKKSARNIEEQLNMPPLETVIIDTNYHFCNIFSQHEEDYTEYTKGTLVGDSISIWFMWVYRQLENLIQLKYDDALVMRMTAAMIESNLRNSRCRNTPFMHVFGPMSLLSKSKAGKDDMSIGSRIARKIYSALAQNKDVHIEQLEQLEQLPIGNDVNFTDWLNRLEIAQTATERDGEPRHYFLEVLIKATPVPAKDNPSLKERPRNVIPLSVYHDDLQYYTDGNYRDIISELRKFDIYDNFSKLIR